MKSWACGTSDIPLEGVQYHPESFLTLEGIKLLRNFLEQEPVSEADSRSSMVRPQSHCSSW